MMPKYFCVFIIQKKISMQILLCRMMITMQCFFYEWVQKYRILCHVIGISSCSENLNLYNVLYSHRVIESSLVRVSKKKYFLWVFRNELKFNALDKQI